MYHAQVLFSDIYIVSRTARSLQTSERTTPNLFEFLAVSTGIVQYLPLEQLTVPETIFGPLSYPLLIKILACCPRIEHLVVEMDRHFDIGTLDSVHETVLNWGTVYRAWIRSLDVASSELLIGGTPGATTIETPSESDSGWQKLDLHLYGPVWSKLKIHVRFERECRDLVGLSAFITSRGVQLVAPWIERFSNTLQQLDLECGSHMRDTPFKLLGQILGSVTALRRLRFISETGLTKEDSIAVFREKLWQQDDDQEEIALVVTETGKVEDAHSAWASRDLESLVIKGLWGTLSDRPEKGHDAVTLQAASEMHQWVVYGSSGFGKRFKKVISDRIQTLPALRALTLNDAVFEYSKARCHSKPNLE
ncbi:hypothetical protein BGZ74_006996 [Mortierella antarctica]|nr:hypothetical protein BGZ74_006996 [Mortierella antarctica]